MRRLLPSFLRSLTAVVPLVLLATGCDKMKKDDADAGLVVAALVDAGGVPPAVPATPTAVVTAAPPLGATPGTPTANATTTATVAPPKATGDAGKPATDAGPAATAVPTIPPFPTALPSGFPTALPSGFPQIPLDAGAFKPPWQQ